MELVLELVPKTTKIKIGENPTFDTVQQPVILNRLLFSYNLK